MVTQTFAKLLLCGVVILTGLVTIPVAVAAIGEEEASLQRQGDRRQYGQAIDLTAGGSHIGISIVDVERDSADIATEEGALVNEVRPESPAQAAGIQAGDVVVEFNGERVGGARQLTRLVQETPARRTVSATVFRDGTRISLDITPEAGPAVFGYLPGFDMDHIGRRVQSAMRRIPNWIDADPLVLGMLPPRGRLGIRAQSVSGQLAEHFGVDGGVLVAYVSDGTERSVSATMTDPEEERRSRRLQQTI